jgi:DNA-binding MarR family transcriptional regulator
VRVSHFHKLAVSNFRFPNKSEPQNVKQIAMSKNAQKAAQELLDVLPLVMRLLQLKMRQSELLSSPAHFGILMMLRDSGRSLSEMAKVQQVSLPTMSNSVSNLVEHQLVKRSRSDDDRRQVLIELTEKGLQTLETIQAEMVSHIQASLSVLDDIQIFQLMDGFAAMRAAFATSILEEDN